MNILLQDGISGAYSARSRGELDMASRQPYVQTLLTMERQNFLKDRIRLAFDLKAKVVPAQLLPPIIARNVSAIAGISQVKTHTTTIP